MSMLLVVETKSESYSPNDLKYAAKSLAGGKLDQKAVEAIVSISGLPLIEEAFVRVGYNLETLAFANNAYLILVAKDGKKKKLSEVEKAYVRGSYELINTLKSKNRSAKEFSFPKPKLFCKDPSAALQSLGAYILGEKSD